MADTARAQRVPRSIADKVAPSTRKISGTANGKVDPHDNPYIKKTLNHLVEGVMLALPIVMARASYRHAVASVRWTPIDICLQPIAYREKPQPNG